MSIKKFNNLHEEILIGLNKKSKTSGGTADILPFERSKATFDSKQLTIVLDGGPEHHKQKQFIRSVVSKSDNFCRYQLERPGLINEGMRRVIEAH